MMVKPLLLVVAGEDSPDTGGVGTEIATIQQQIRVGIDLLQQIIQILWETCCELLLCVFFLLTVCDFLGFERVI